MNRGDLRETAKTEPRGLLFGTERVFAVRFFPYGPGYYLKGQNKLCPACRDTLVNLLTFDVSRNRQSLYRVPRIVGIQSHGLLLYTCPPFGDQRNRQLASFSRLYSHRLYQGRDTRAIALN